VRHSHVQVRFDGTQIEKSGISVEYRFFPEEYAVALCAPRHEMLRSLEHEVPAQVAQDKKIHGLKMLLDANASTERILNRLKLAFFAEFLSYSSVNPVNFLVMDASFVVWMTVASPRHRWRSLSLIWRSYRARLAGVDASSATETHGAKYMSLPLQGAAHCL